MASLGALERAVMDVLWESEIPLSANDLRDHLAVQPDASEPGVSAQPDTSPKKELAATTVLTVLSRLENKGFVTRDRGTRPHVYRSVTTRADHTAELMHEVLGSSPDREAALARFIGSVTAQEADTLRDLLGGIPAPRT